MIPLDRSIHGRDPHAYANHVAYDQTVAKRAPVRRLLDWTRYTRHGKALLARARDVRTGRVRAPNSDKKAEVAKIMRDARWCFESAARLILVRRASNGIPRAHVGSKRSILELARLAKRCATPPPRAKRDEIQNVVASAPDCATVTA